MRLNAGQIVHAVIDRLKNEGAFDNCTTCMYWDDKNEMCEKFKQRPPAKVIVHGCEFHDVIPF